jgi:hypothetical protein
MQNILKLAFAATALALAGGCDISAVAAQQPTYPAKPVKIIIPLGPGNSLEIAVRLVADKLAAALGQPFIIEPQPGAAGQIGTERVARAPADGYTLLAANAGLAVSLLFLAAAAYATAFDVTVDSTSLKGSTAVLAFDFINGGPPDNTVNLSTLISNGTQGSTSIAGNVTGAGPWRFFDAGNSFFNELLVTFNPMGSALSFSFTTTDNAPPLGPFLDAFSFFVLDPFDLLPLITTNAPGGSGALFEFDITGQGIGGLSVFTPNEAGFSIQVTPQGVPEPGSLALLCAGVVALSVRKRSLR